ncbi:MAG TPA: arsenic resistance N-acetyltransferase ArsN2 [Burkholderiales bacterium]|nr:arsenic resistance N-acetyltransferase ArsN2 [Burkholderiales bacterium]
MAAPIQSVSNAKEITALLVACGLPASDLVTGRAVELFGARDGQAWCAVVGLERLGTFGLLRSLAVTPSWRGRGWGRALVAHVEAYAASRGVTELYLLTTTADRFFEKLGYEVILRVAVPAAIQATSEFSHLCPASSVCLWKPLVRR